MFSFNTRFSAQSEPVLFEPPYEAGKQATFMKITFYKMNAENKPQVA